MIQRFTVSNYKALREVSLTLTPVHALIGPNDSGKTSILEAMAALSRTVDFKPEEVFVGPWDGTDLVWRGAKEPIIRLAAEVTWRQKRFSYGIDYRFGRGRCPLVAGEMVNGQAPLEGETPRTYRVTWPTQARSDNGEDIIAGATVHDALSGVHYCQWNARFLSVPVAPDSSRQFQLEPSGFGLALCLDDILGFDRDRFISLEQRFCGIFPHIKAIRLLPQRACRDTGNYAQPMPILQSADGKGLFFDLAGSEKRVSAAQVSDGVLLVLAYLTILHLPSPPRLILVEEPENGIHPKRLQDVLRILRDLVAQQNYSQIVLTTHSPYIVDLFAPNEVSLCKKEDDGSVSVRQLSQSATVRDQLDVFGLGEIWTAEGDDALTLGTPANGEAGK